jgi:hypothetical protein
LALTLDDYQIVLLNFLATLFGVIFAFGLTARYDRLKQREEDKQTQIRVLRAIKSELDMDLGMINAMVEKGTRGYAVTFFLVDSYRSAISSGDFSLLNPMMQNSLAFAYLQFQQMDIMSDRLASAVSIPVSQNAIPNVATVILDALTELEKSTIPIVSEVTKRIDAELDQLTGTQNSAGAVSQAHLLTLIEVVDGQFKDPRTLHQGRNSDG